MDAEGTKGMRNTVDEAGELGADFREDADQVIASLVEEAFDSIGMDPGAEERILGNLCAYQELRAGAPAARKRVAPWKVALPIAASVVLVAVAAFAVAPNVIGGIPPMQSAFEASEDSARTMAAESAAATAAPAPAEQAASSGAATPQEADSRDAVEAESAAQPDSEPADSGASNGAGFSALAAVGTESEEAGGVQDGAGETAATEAAAANAEATEAADGASFAQSSSVTFSRDGREASFELVLEDGPAARAFAELLPLDVAMSELNGNEKYVYVGTSLPAASQAVGHIEAGDVMLYGSDCIVVFYESFDTSYSYTRIGQIPDARGLADALGPGSVTAHFGF